MPPPAHRPVFLILPGITADADRLSSSRELAEEHWPEARVEIPNYLARWRGVRGTGRWLDRWASESLAEGERVYVLAYILGAAALPYAPLLRRRISRLVVLRSRYQEAIPRALRRRWGPLLCTLLFGKAISDLGREPFWPEAFRPDCPLATLLETRPSALAVRMRIAPLSDAELAIAAYQELAISHDFAYHSRGLVLAATDWLKAG